MLLTLKTDVGASFASAEGEKCRSMISVGTIKIVESLPQFSPRESYEIDAIYKTR